MTSTAERAVARRAALTYDVTRHGCPDFFSRRPIVALDSGKPYKAICPAGVSQAASWRMMDRFVRLNMSISFIRYSLVLQLASLARRLVIKQIVSKTTFNL